MCESSRIPRSSTLAQGGTLYRGTGACWDRGGAGTGPAFSSSSGWKRFETLRLSSTTPHHATPRDRQQGLFNPHNAEAGQLGRERGGGTTMDRQQGLFNPHNAEAVQLGRERGGGTTMDRQQGLFNPHKAEAVQLGWERGGGTTMDRQQGLFDPQLLQLTLSRPPLQPQRSHWEGCSPSVEVLLQQILGCTARTPAWFSGTGARGPGH